MLLELENYLLQQGGAQNLYTKVWGCVGGHRVKIVLQAKVVHLLEVH